MQKQRLFSFKINKLQKNQLIPADILILEIADRKKECYVETKNLDGETNLKIKEIPEFFRNYQRFWVEKQIDSFFEYAQPNKHLEDFHGNLQISQNGSSVATDFVESKHLLLRGCTLRTTEWVKGVVVFTGKETKIQLNSCESQQKFSSLETMMNKFIIIIFFIQVIICFCSGLFGTFWMQEHKLSLPYLHYSPPTTSEKKLMGGFDFMECFQIMGTWILIFTNFIPISLIVTLEVVKYIQGSNLESDKENYFECKVQSSNLNEELGQIKYIFSDKTGTLTQNSMKFKCLSIAGLSFGEANSKDANSRDETQHFLESHLQNECVNFYDPYFTNILLRGESDQQQRIINTLKHMALCHNVVPLGPTSYSGPSPDEICLVSFALSQGVQFINKNDDNIITINIKIGNQFYQEKYKLLQTFEFNSDRKRMSVVIQSVGNIMADDLILLTKGADNVMEKRLANQKYDEQTNKDLQKYSEYGYRTLVLASRRISREEFFEFQQELSKAKMLQQFRDQAIDELQDRMEQNLEYLAVTGVEDELQADVADTIQKIKEANIYFWVLTGDKEETAISIGHATKVIGDETTTKIIQISAIVKSIQQQALLTGVKKSLEQVLNDAIAQATQLKNEFKKQSLNSFQFKIALIVKGDDLITISAHEYLQTAFLKMAIECDTVVASRVSPLQKKLIVDMVRSELPDVSTLAIGDGANDVSMISAAHVGVGIRGKEGTQAERSSDYAIPEFRYLGKLLFDFGRECYRKNSELVLYNFYKNMLLVLPQWWFGMMNGFSGVALYDPWLYQLYNTCFTSLPIVIYAVEDRQYSLKKLMKYPLDFYEQGQLNRLFSYRRFLATFFNGSIGAGLIMLLSFFCFENMSIEKRSSHLSYLQLTGMISFGCSIIISNLRILTFSHGVSAFQTICVFGSYAFYVICYFLYEKYFKLADISNTFSIQFTSLIFYILNILLIGMTSFIDLGTYVFSINDYELKQIRKQQKQEMKPRVDLNNSKKLNLMANSAIIHSSSHQLYQSNLPMKQGVFQNNDYNPQTQSRY